jgi:hypothetical protein
MEQQQCIMISKAFCISLKNRIYPVVAPRDKQQVSSMAPASNVYRSWLLPKPPEYCYTFIRLKTKHVFSLVQTLLYSSVTFLQNSGVIIISTRTIDICFFLFERCGVQIWARGLSQFFPVLQDKGRGLPCIRPQPLPPTSFPCHRSCHHSTEGCMGSM